MKSFEIFIIVRRFLGILDNRLKLAAESQIVLHWFNSIKWLVTNARISISGQDYSWAFLGERTKCSFEGTCATAHCYGAFEFEYFMRLNGAHDIYDRKARLDREHVATKTHCNLLSTCNFKNLSTFSMRHPCPIHGAQRRVEEKSIRFALKVNCNCSPAQNVLVNWPKWKCSSKADQQKTIYALQDEIETRPRVSTFVSSLVNYENTIPAATDPDAKPPPPVARMGKHI